MDGLLSTRNVGRLAAGGAGIIISMLTLYRRGVPAFSDFLPRLGWTAGCVAFGFAVGVLVVNAAIWIAGKLGPRGVKSAAAGAGKKTTGSLSNPPARERGGRSPSRPTPTITPPSPAPRPPAVGGNEIEPKAKAPTMARPRLPESERSGGRSGGRGIYLIPALASILFLGAVGAAAWYFIKRPATEGGETTNANRVEDPGPGDRPDAEAEERANATIEKKPAELRPLLREYRKRSKDIDELLRGGLEERNIGGAVTVAVTNWQFNGTKRVFKRPEEMGFQKVANDDALVNLARGPDVTIESIRITKVTDSIFNVTIKAFNNTKDFKKVAIHKGQVFELQDVSAAINNYQSGLRRLKKFRQGVATANEGDNGGIYGLPPVDRGTIELTAYCINEDLTPPEGPAYITIYELENADFDSPDELHANMRRINLALLIDGELNIARRLLLSLAPRASLEI